MQSTFDILRWLLVAIILLTGTTTLSAQTTANGVSAPATARSTGQEDEMAMSSTAWQFMQDGVVFGTFSSQNGPRGSDEFRSQNWWMGMATRRFSSGASLTLTSMASLEPVTVRGGGYAELFQVGETWEDLPIVDRQHPHDFFMQLSSAFRMPVGDNAGLTIAGALVGDPALGPVAFMHRQSAGENPIAPLSHHTLDSTHVGMGVITAGVDVGPLALEGSIFQGAEPDENRWDLDLGSLDSWSTRLWYRPSAAWEFQVSHGYLTRPEAFEPQDIKRSTASMAWSRENGDDFTALTVAFGRNVRDFSTLNAVLAEITHRFSRNALYSRVEWVELETEHLLFPGFLHTPHPGELIDPLTVVTVGAVRDIADIGGFNLGLGGDVSLYVEPANLQRTHGDTPVAFHLFFRLRIPATMGRMWGHTMAQPMRGHRSMMSSMSR